METESQTEETTSLLTRQPSGIRALPSNDDDDGSDSDPVFEINSSPEKTSDTDEKSSNSITVSSKASSFSRSDSTTNDCNTSFSYDPDEKTIEKPIAKVSVYEEDDDSEVGDRTYASENASRVRVSGEEDLEDENVVEVTQEEDKVDDKGDDNESLNPKIDEYGAANSREMVEGVGEEVSSERDAIDVDFGEAVRSGVAVVGVEKEEDSEVSPSENESVVEESNLVESETTVKDEEKKVSDVEVGKEEMPVVQESTPLDSVAIEAKLLKPTDERYSAEDSVVEVINVDIAEAVHSGVVAVGDTGVEVKETEVKEVGPTITENVALGIDFDPLADSNTTGLSTDPECEQNHSVANEAEMAQPQQIVDQTTSGNDENASPSNEPEPVGEVEGVSAKDDTGDELGVEAGEPRDVCTSRMEIESAVDQSERIVSEVVTDSEEEEGDSENELFDSATLAALLKAANSADSDPGTITITSPDGSRLFSVERPAGLGSSLRSVRPAERPSNSSFLSPPSLGPPTVQNLGEEEKKKLQHIHDLRVKFLRLVHRLGHTAEDSLAAQVLYRLTLLAGRPTSPAFSLDSAKQKAMQLDAEEKDSFHFSLNILVLGKTGVGKSATINSLFGAEKVKSNAFEPETTSVQVVDGIVDGVHIRIIDAPGLKCSGIEQCFNRKILASVKKYTKKYPPDIMLYVDRLDSPVRSLNDLPMLKTISSCLGSSIWRSAVVALTHASSAPPDGPSGSPLSYEVFVAQRSHIVQQSIGQATGDMRLMNPSLMNPVSLVENHPACRKNREGQKVLPNGQTWRPQLLLLCYSLKILSEASSASKPQDPFDHRKLFGFRSRAPPLPYLLSSLLQTHAHPKLSTHQGGDYADSDIDLDDLSDSDEEEEDEYDQLPPFKPLRKSQIAKLSKEQKKAYFEEYDYRVRLLQKKQWREELKRMREMKKSGKVGVDEYGEMPEDFDAENGTPAVMPVPMPDMVLPPTFDSNNPAYRYRFLEPTSQFLARPVLDTHGWDHDCGYDGVNVEQNLGIAGRFPAAVSVQVTKDKKDFNIHLDSAVSAKHGDTGSSLVGFDIQTIGKQLAYIVRGDTKFKKMKNKAGAGVSVTFLGENVATGLKLEDQIPVGRRLVLVGSAGTVRSQKDAAYGANLEVRLREADYPIGQDQSSVVLSLMRWRGDLAVGANLQSQFSVGRGSKMAVRVGLNNKLSGQISVRTSSSDHLQLALAGLVPIAVSIYRNLKPGVSENISLY